MSIYIGIDNGVTGSIGVIDEEGTAYLFPTPVKSSLNYQKTKVKHITRIDVKALRSLLARFVFKDGVGGPLTTKMSARVLIERPYTSTSVGKDGARKINYDAMISGMRALEAILITIESLGLGYNYCDSKEWQRVVLPYISVADKKEYPAKLKQVSLEVGQRLYPSLDWGHFKDADGLLIAVYLKRMNNG